VEQKGKPRWKSFDQEDGHKRVYELRSLTPLQIASNSSSPDAGKRTEEKDSNRDKAGWVRNITTKEYRLDGTATGGTETDGKKMKRGLSLLKGGRGIS